LTHEGDWVFDPYAGVGSSPIAAIKHNRRAIASEKETQDVDITHERLTSFFNGTLRLRPLGKAVHKPTGREKVSQVPSEWENATQQRLLEERENYE
jgi:hypothetical protein